MRTGRARRASRNPASSSPRSRRCSWSRASRSGSAGCSACRTQPGRPARRPGRAAGSRGCAPGRANTSHGSPVGGDGLAAEQQRVRHPGVRAAGHAARSSAARLETTRRPASRGCRARGYGAPRTRFPSSPRWPARSPQDRRPTTATARRSRRNDRPRSAASHAWNAVRLARAIRPASGSHSRSPSPNVTGHPAARRRPTARPRDRNTDPRGRQYAVPECWPSHREPGGRSPPGRHGVTLQTVA